MYVTTVGLNVHVHLFSYVLQRYSKSDKLTRNVVLSKPTIFRRFEPVLYIRTPGYNVHPSP